MDEEGPVATKGLFLEVLEELQDSFLSTEKRAKGTFPFPQGWPESSGFSVP